MKFDKKYTEYWTSAVDKSVDGTSIAGVKEVLHLLQYLRLDKSDLVLDLGCSFGRMHQALAEYSKFIYGVDLDDYAVKKARKKPYIDVRVGSAEHTGFDKNFFNVVFCWAVFDVVDHKKGFREINRILKNQGKLFISGKNDTYFKDDTLAFNAEKNAFLKDFPNKFTDLSSVLLNLKLIGFKLDKLLIFPRRGDVGLLNFIDKGIETKDNCIGYEYLIICHKIGRHDARALKDISLENSTSKTAKEKANEAGFKGAEELFNSLGIN